MNIRSAFTTLLLVLAVSVAHGASCPYCGQTYGVGGSRDQAYIQRIRAEHEASCPARFQNNNPQNNPQPPPGPSAEARRKRELEEQENKLLREAETAYRDEDYARAAAAYRQLIVLHPTARAWYGLGCALWGDGKAQRPQRMDAYRQALKLDPDYEPARKAVVSLENEVRKEKEETDEQQRGEEEAAKKWTEAYGLAQAGRYSEAEEAYRRMIKLGPTTASRYYALGWVIAKQGRYAEAEKTYRDSIALEERAGTYNSLGIALEELDRYDEAIAAYRRAISLDRNVLYATENLQRAEERMKQQREIEAGQRRQTQEATENEAQRQREQQAEFQVDKQDLLARLKVISPSSKLDLSRPGDTETSGLRLKPIPKPTSRDVPITNPQIAKIMRGLQDIQVPPPLSQKEASLSWKRVSDSGWLKVSDSSEAVLEQTGDVGFLVWDLTGRLGSKVLLPCKVLLIAGRTFIAGEEGAYVHLVKEHKVYESALQYLKNPTTSRQFADLVRDLKETGRAPESADPDMVRAVRAIQNPSLGNSGMRIAWDSMLSREALLAMVRKACLESGAELVGLGTEGLLSDLTKQKTLYEAARLERNAALRMLKQPKLNPIEKDQLRKVITHANHVLENLYRLEGVGPALTSEKIAGLASDLETIPVSGEAEGPRTNQSPQVK